MKTFQQIIFFIPLFLVVDRSSLHIILWFFIEKGKKSMDHLNKRLFEVCLILFGCVFLPQIDLFYFNYPQVKGFTLFSTTMFCKIKKSLTLCGSFAQWTKTLNCYNLDSKPTFAPSTFLPQNSYGKLLKFLQALSLNRPEKVQLGIVVLTYIERPH